ncbi:GNAT family N-acetyltransferase [Chitinimonas lacunae]|uniref:GNAT family N-acetyltransferase n=1 Tax=Chitinimonas lacunae TaxID=1963018 RepID=A0ABV8MUG8_9NEIS
MKLLPKLPGPLARRLQERKRLRQANGYHFAIASRLRQLNPADWEAVTARGSFFFSADYLTLLEQAGPDNLEPRYALISDDERPLAAVCMQIVRVSLNQLGQPADSKLKDKLAQRILVCGNLLSYGMHAVCFAPDVDPAAVWPAVAEALYRVRRAEKIAGQTNIVLIKDLPELHRQQSAALAGLSYAAVETEPNMVLSLGADIGSYADYLASLTSKYRSAIKQQVMKPFEAAGFAIRPIDQPEALRERLQALYLQVHGNASLRPFTLNDDYWPALQAAAGERLVIHGAFQGDTLHGFIATLKDGDTAYAYHIGFDREVARSGIPLYLRLLHASLAQSLDFGCRRISFGRTALEPKARLGCEPETIHVWVRHRQPMLNQFIRPLLRFIQHEEAPEFSPFKRSSSEGVSV